MKKLNFDVARKKAMERWAKNGLDNSEKSGLHGSTHQNTL